MFYLYIIQLNQKPKKFGCPYTKQVTKSLPTIVSCSNYVFPKPKDCSEHIHYTGYWFLEDTKEYTPSDELKNFLEEGPPPIYVGFGSISSTPSQAMKMTKIIIEALNHCKQRGILATGWNGMSKLDDVPKNIYMLESIPHSWLFPKMAAVIHHGGAGTTAAGFRAGVPSIIIPFANDQFGWALRAYELGVGSKSIPRKELTVEKLVVAINYVLKDEIKNKAYLLGQNIQKEDGVKNATKIIMSCLESNNIIK